MIRRVEAAREAMAAAGVELLAVSPSDDLRYLVGFSPTADERPCALLVGAAGAVFVVPALNAAQSEAALPDLDVVAWTDADGARGAFAAALGRFPPPRRAAVDGTMRADVLLLLQSLLPSAAFVPATAVLGELRLRKDAGEVDALVRAAAAADAAMRAALEACVEGARESDVAGAATAALGAAGAETPFASVASGPNGAFPHHHTGTRVLQRGDLVTVDLGGRVANYWCDLTRMAHVGEPDERDRELHDVVERAVRAALGAARAGATCADVDAAARAVIGDAGYAHAFVHRTGHGLGVSLHEPPWIMAGNAQPLEPGMVFSIEPGLYFPGDRGLRLEEIVVVTDGGCRVLGTLPRDVHVA
jgi:Xaa-Pro aminopeptidase